MIATTTASDLVEALRGIVRAGRAAQHSADDDLHNAPAALLGLLAREGEQRMGRVAGALDVDPSVVSRQVAMLCAAGLVSRRPDPEDGRASLLELTESGRACLEQHRAQWARRFTTALAHWDDDDATQLLTLLRRLSADVRGHLVQEKASPAPGMHPELRTG